MEDGDRENHLHWLVKKNKIHQLRRKASHIVACALPGQNLESEQHRHLQESTKLRPTKPIKINIITTT